MAGREWIAEKVALLIEMYLDDPSPKGVKAIARHFRVGVGPIRGRLNRLGYYAKAPYQDKDSVRIIAPWPKLPPDAFANFDKADMHMVEAMASTKRLVAA